MLRRRVLENEAERADSEKFVSTVVAMVFFPLAAGVLGAFTPDLWKHSQVLTVAAWLVIAASYAIAYVRTFPSTTSFISLAIKAEEQEQQIASLEQNVSALEESITLLSVLNTASLASRRMAAQYIQQAPFVLADFREMCAELLAPVYLESETLFGIGGSERWNFAVYLYSRKLDSLVPIWREKSANHPSEGMGRNWARGKGHVGKAFVDTQPIITGDATHPDVAQFCAVSSDAVRGYDAEVYRSFASFPIGPVLNGESDALGVLVATSDRIGRFSKENTVILLHLADTLAVILSLAKVDVDELLGEASG